jgi:DNA polymerase-3 subunit epsilon
VVWRIGQQYPEIGGATLDDLHTQQIAWAGQQAADLADYFRRTPGKEDRAKFVRGDWPLIPHQRSETR